MSTNSFHRQCPSGVLLLALGIGCSLQDFDKLTKGDETGGTGGKGSTTATGGSSNGGQPQGNAGASVNPNAGTFSDTTAVAGSPGAGGSAPVGGTDQGLGGSSSQAGSAPTLVCEAGLTACPGEAACTNLATAATHCGRCEVSCSLANVSAASCNAGVCSPTCSVGFATCNEPTINDGCETNLTVPESCGQCGHACSEYGARNKACIAGLCVPICAAGYADCAPDVGTVADDGCEVFLDDLKSCGTTCTNRVPCAADQVCNAGACGPAQGLAVLTMPFSGGADKQRYGNKLPTQASLLNATLTIRAYAPGAMGGLMAVYIVDADYSSSPFYYLELSTLSSGWTDFNIPIGGVVGAYDPSSVHQVTIEITGGTGPWASPTVVYFDSIRSSNGSWNDKFDANEEHMLISVNPVAVLEGSTLSWVDAVP